MKSLNFYFNRFLSVTVITAAIFCSCTAKAQSFPASTSDLADVFSEANLPFYKSKISPREFSLPSLAGETQNLGALRGKVVFLNFWATWCGPCRLEMPSMEALYKQNREKGLEIIAINCGEGRQEVQAFMKENGLSFPALLDEDGKVSSSYGIQAIPTSYIIDRNGNIVSRLVGSINWNTAKIQTAIEALLNS